jgi:hypothetical protein
LDQTVYSSLKKFPESYNYWGKRDTVKKNTETLIHASKEVGLKANIEKMKYILLSQHQNAGQNHDMKITIRSFENVVQCKIWSPTLRKEHRLMVFENRMLRSMNGLKRDVTGWWRKLFNEELHNLYSTSSITGMIKSRRMQWQGM